MWIKALPMLAILVTMGQSFQLVLHDEEYANLQNHSWIYLFLQGLAWVCGVSFSCSIGICFCELCMPLRIPFNYQVFSFTQSFISCKLPSL